MSRIGKQPIAIPTNVTVEDGPDGIVVAGPKGRLSQFKLPGISWAVKDGVCRVERADDSKQNRAQHGLMRSLINNMVLGVTEGFSKELEVVGIGYKVRLDGQTLVLNIGFSHEVKFQVPETIDLVVDGNSIRISGINKQQVGQVAAAIRSLKKPEPYKGKGIRYKDEVIRRKAGKGAKE